MAKELLSDMQTLSDRATTKYHITIVLSNLVCPESLTPFLKRDTQSKLPLLMYQLPTTSKWKDYLIIQIFSQTSNFFLFLFFFIILYSIEGIEGLSHLPGTSSLSKQTSITKAMLSESACPCNSFL